MKGLREMRLAKGITQKEVADYLGITQQAYANYESEKREPDNKTACKLADYFHVTTDYLLGRDEPASPPTLDEQLSDIDFALSGEIRDLTDDEKQDILDYVRFKRSQKKGR